MYRPYQDGSLVFEVRLGDVMDLICPFYDEQQSYMTSELEQYDIYRVCCCYCCVFLLVLKILF